MIVGNRAIVCLHKNRVIVHLHENRVIVMAHTTSRLKTHVSLLIDNEDRRDVFVISHETASAFVPKTSNGNRSKIKKRAGS